jgi:hypothetical protein
MGGLLPAPPIDQELLAENEELHRRGYFGGLALAPHMEAIGRLCERFGCVSLLDFGSGKGELWVKPRPRGLRKMHVQLYDPAYAPHAHLPDRSFDAVICVDVLEHIPERDLAGTMEAIAARAAKLVYLVICPRAGTKVLPHAGTDVHVTIRPAEWWLELVAARCQRDGLAVEVRFSE